MVLFYEDVDEREVGLADPDATEDEEVTRLLTLVYSEIDGLDEAARRAAVERQALTMGRILKSLKATQTLLEGHALETQMRVEHAKKRYEALRSWTQNLLAQEGIDKVKDPLVTVYLSGQAASWQVDDEGAVPAEFVTARLKMTLAEAREMELEAWLDSQEVSKTRVEANFKETGEVPAGMTRISDKKHLVVR